MLFRFPYMSSVVLFLLAAVAGFAQDLPAVAGVLFWASGALAGYGRWHHRRPLPPRQ